MYFSNLLALWSFQWVLPPKMYFSTAAVSWTKASICSCRLRHQLQIDFITHSNPQLGIANATLMRTRNPKQVYIVFCPVALLGAAEMIPTPATFLQDFFLLHFCFAAVFWLCWPNAGCRQSAECSHKERETWGGRTLDLAAARPYIFQVSNTHWPVTTRQRPMTSLRFFVTICLCTTSDKSDPRYKWRYDGAILVR